MGHETAKKIPIILYQNGPRLFRWFSTLPLTLGSGRTQTPNEFPRAPGLSAARDRSTRFGAGWSGFPPILRCPPSSERPASTPNWPPKTKRQGFDIFRTLKLYRIWSQVPHQVVCGFVFPGGYSPAAEFLRPAFQSRTVNRTWP